MTIIIWISISVILGFVGFLIGSFSGSEGMQVICTIIGFFLPSHIALGVKTIEDHNNEEH